MRASTMLKLPALPRWTGLPPGGRNINPQEPERSQTNAQAVPSPGEQAIQVFFWQSTPYMQYETGTSTKIPSLNSATKQGSFQSLFPAGFSTLTREGPPCS